MEHFPRLGSTQPLVAVSQPYPSKTTPKWSQKSHARPAERRNNHSVPIRHVKVGGSSTHKLRNPLPGPRSARSWASPPSTNSSPQNGPKRGQDFGMSPNPVRRPIGHVNIGGSATHTSRFPQVASGTSRSRPGTSRSRLEVPVLPGPSSQKADSPFC